MHRFWALVLLLAVASGHGVTAAKKDLQSKSGAGYVLEVEGKWYLEKKPREYLVLGQRLGAGDVIRILSPAASDHLVISNPSGEIVIERHCDNHGDCSRHVIVPSPADTESNFFDVILQTAMRLIRGKPDRYSVHGVRGVNNDLAEAVCRFDKGSLNLSPAFRHMPSGLYYLKLRSLQPGMSSTAIGPLRFQWDPQGGSLLPVSGLTPGLYEIRLLLRTSDDYEPTSLTVWTLVSSSSEFDHTNDLFRQAVTLTGKWGKTITDETKRQVLRAYLDNLTAAR